MLGDISKVENIYIACGNTDLRLGIDGLAQLVQQQFHLDPFSSSLFVFCGRRRDRIKALLWEGDGFVLLCKRVEDGAYQWPRDRQEMQKTRLERNYLNVRSTSIGIEGKCKRGLFGTISLTLGNSPFLIYYRIGKSKFRPPNSLDGRNFFLSKCFYIGQIFCINCAADFAISRLVPFWSKAISSSASPPIGLTDTTMPSPNALWRTRQPAEKSGRGALFVRTAEEPAMDGVAAAAETYRALRTCARGSSGSGWVACWNIRASPMLLSSVSRGISSMKREGCAYCVRPYSIRRSAQVRYSCSLARVTAT